MSVRTILAFLVAFAPPLICAAPARADLRVVTTTTDLADIARTIGGDHVQVEAICQGPQDPHHVQARPSYMVRLARADLLLAVGLELEVGWLPGLIRGARNPSINPGRPGYLEGASAITPIDVPRGLVDRSQGDVHRLGNPHFWLDPENTMRVVSAIAGRMGELDASNAALYQRNATALRERLRRALTRWHERLAPFRGARVVSYHATFNYFLRQFGLEGSGYIEERPGIPPAPAHLARLIQTMRSQGVHVILHERYFNRQTSELVAGRTGAHLVVLPTSVGGVNAATSYEALMDHLVNSVATALDGSR